MKTIQKEKIVVFTIFIFLYVGCLLLPSIIVGENKSSPNPGWNYFRMGWLGVLTGEFSWFANPAMLFALIHYDKGNYSKSLGYAIASVILILSFVIRGNIVTDSGGSSREVSEYLIGFWLWILSAVFLAYASYRLYRNLEEEPDLPMYNEEYEYAGFWIRVGATLIDTLLLKIITLPLIIMRIYGDLIWKGGALILDRNGFLINYALPFIAIVLFWFYKSATPGKMALNIKVVNANDGGKLSFGQSIRRCFAYIPSILVFFIGIFWIDFDKRKQGWHDKLAGTIVIKKKKVVTTKT